MNSLLQGKPKAPKSYSYHETSSTTVNFLNLFVYYVQNLLYDTTDSRLFYTENLSKIVPWEIQIKHSSL